MISTIFLGLMSLNSLWAQEVVPSKDPESKVILIEESRGKTFQQAPKVFVESGTENLSGSPEEGIKPAYRTWEQRCQEWKNELKQLNGSNLMVAQCGTPQRSQEMIQSEKWYTYHSKATYKIRVVGK